MDLLAWPPRKIAALLRKPKRARYTRSLASRNTFLALVTRNRHEARGEAGAAYSVGPSVAASSGGAASVQLPPTGFGA
jgi:hypothetical protein